MAFGHFLLGSHNLMVTALGLCMKWPLVPHVMLFVSQILFFATYHNFFSFVEHKFTYPARLATHVDRHS